MNQLNEESFDCLVVGGGALGLLLTYALTEMDSKSVSPRNVFAHNRSPLPAQIRLDLKLGHERLFSVDSTHGDPASLLQTRSPKIVFFCVPPESTESVFNLWLDSILGKSKVINPVLFVFCNNGCLTPEILARIAKTDSRFAFARALFFVGAMKEKDHSSIVVRWTGGQQVVWGPLKAPNLPHQDTHTSRLEQLFQIPSAIGFLKWQFVNEIFTVEREKFFTNFMLASGIGPRLIQNKSLANFLDDSVIFSLAKQFQILWHSFGVSAEKLQSTLQKTIQDTGDNINSLSFAGAHGNCSTLNWFVKFIQNEILACERGEELRSLQEFLESVRADWKG